MSAAERESPVAAPHRPAALDRDPGQRRRLPPRGATAGAGQMELLAWVVGDRKVGGVPFEIAVPGTKDDVLESIAIALLGEEVAGEVPPLDIRVVRSVVTRELRPGPERRRRLGFPEMNSSGGRRRKRERSGAASSLPSRAERRANLLSPTLIPPPVAVPVAGGAMATAATNSSHRAVASSTAPAKPGPRWRRGGPPARCRSQGP